MRWSSRPADPPNRSVRVLRRCRGDQGGPGSPEARKWAADRVTLRRRSGEIPAQVWTGVRAASSGSSLGSRRSFCAALVRLWCSGAAQARRRRTLLQRSYGAGVARVWWRLWGRG